LLELYKSCYGLEGEPFRLSPDHRFSYAHRSYAHARSYLEYALSQGEGFIVITGEAGTGKTTLISDLLENMDRSSAMVVTLTSAQLDMEHLVMLVISSFGLSVSDNSIALLLVELKKFLVRLHQKGGRAILILDEAQGLSRAALEELRLLSNLQHENRLLLQIFLLGQDGLLEKIQAHGMENLHQRIIATSRLEPLDLEETVAYLEYRLCHVGWKGDPAISAQAVRIIHRFSGGIPRRINLIAHRLFLFGGIHRKHRLSGDDAKRVVEELRRERLLACDVSTLSVPDAPEQSEEDAGDTGVVLSLPRGNPAGSDAQDCGQPAEGDAIATPAGDGEPDSGQETGADPRTAASGDEPGPGPVDDPGTQDSAAEIGGGPAAFGRLAGEPVQRFWPVVLLIMLMTLVLAISTNDDFRTRLIEFVRLVLNRIEHDPVVAPAGVPDRSALPRLPDGGALATGEPRATRHRAGSPVAQHLPSDHTFGLQPVAFRHSWVAVPGADLQEAIPRQGKSASGGAGVTAMSGTTDCAPGGKVFGGFGGAGEEHDSVARYFPVTLCASEPWIPGQDTLANGWLALADIPAFNRQGHAGRAIPERRSGALQPVPAEGAADSPSRGVQPPPAAEQAAIPASQPAAGGTVDKQAESGRRKARYLHALLQPGWLRDGEPVGYLSSLICDCSKHEKTVTCESNRRHKHVGGRFVRYLTRSVIEHISDAGTFRITYRHFIIEVDGNGADSAGAASGERVDPAGEFPLSPGWGPRHILQCHFTGDAALSCSKDTKFTFNLTSRNFLSLDM
jgi:type II secretory pathway predicted ATPase ExeA